jgi:predicted O-methyltransferase YrrM
VRTETPGQVEKDPLFASIATKIVEFAGLDNKVKVWMGHLEAEMANVEIKLSHQCADFVLCDHSPDRYVEDLKLLEARGIIDPAWTVVLADIESYPGDPKFEDLELEEAVQADIRQYLSGHELATLL